MNKRHAKPTTPQLVGRIYRHQLAMESETRSALAMLSERIESIQTDIDSIGTSLADTLKTLTDHCRRLLKEKETLMSIARPELERRQREANDYMAKPQGMSATEYELRRLANGFGPVGANGPGPCPKGSAALDIGDLPSLQRIYETENVNGHMRLETLNYPCGCSATGTAPLPDYCSVHGCSCHAPGGQMHEPDCEWWFGENAT